MFDGALFAALLAFMLLSAWFYYKIWGREEGQPWYDFTGPRSLDNFSNHEWLRWVLLWTAIAGVTLFQLLL